MKSSVLKDYYEKMRIVELIRTIVKKEKLDPNIKTNFETKDPNITKHLNEEIKKFVVMYKLIFLIL